MVNKSPKPCKSNQIRNPVSNRCVNKSGKIGKAILDKKSSSNKSSKNLKPCKNTQIRNPETNRCVNKSGKIGKYILGNKSPNRNSNKKKSTSRKSTSRKSTSRKSTSRKSTSRKSTSRKSTKKSKKPCKSHQRRNDNGRCVNKSDNKRVRSTKSKKPCKSHQIRNDKGRCVNKSDHKRVRSKVREPVKREDKGGRWSRNKRTAEDCIKRSNVGLRDIQIKVIQYMIDHDSLLVVHGTGCGKTLTAIGSSQCYLDANPEKNVIFVGPASLASNFKKEMKKFGVTNPEKYTFYSFDKFMIEAKSKRPVSCKDSFLIIDEAHNLRNPKSKKSIAVVECAMKADKRLLLTATPFVNSMEDFIPLINMLHGSFLVGTKKQFYKDEVNEWLGKSINDQSISTFRYLLEDKVDMVDCRDPKFFPDEITEYMNVPMTKEYWSRYKRVVAGESLFGIAFSNPSAFYNGYRRAVNRTGPEYYSAKINKALPILKKGKSIIYTNWVDFGIRPLTQALKVKGISYKTFYGSTDKDERTKMIEDFNNDEFQVLVITKAGGEGIDLKGVRSVVVLDPPWNDASLRQVIGRAVRYNSHAHLPKNERKVNVYMMVLKEPVNLSPSEKSMSGDVLLYGIIERKNELSSLLLELLKDLSI
jgi:superfamily II DNA or RNA helicase